MAANKAAFIEFENEQKPDLKVTAKFKKLATQGIELDQQIKALTKQKNAIKKELQEEFGEQEQYTIIVPGVGTVPVIPKEQTVIADLGRLKEVLGPNLESYVDLTLSAKPLDLLEKLLANSELPMHDLVSECCTVKLSCAWSFKPEKK